MLLTIKGDTLIKKSLQCLICTISSNTGIESHINLCGLKLTFEKEKIKFLVLPSQAEYNSELLCTVPMAPDDQGPT